MEPISSVPKQSPETTIHTAGGAYISGNVVAETFIGRDQYNYYFIGLAPLVHDPTRRFRNFLNEYLGTPGQPVPFGGRQAQLAELHSWLDAADAPPYYLMTAEAGRGKSALVCRWMEEVREQRPEVEVIFIPISIRFETAAQDTVFAALAARLAQLYDEPIKPAALSGAQWQGVCESYLDRTPPAGKQLLIILDGLDEATGWQFGAGFFSTNPPPGLRIVVTARLRVGESTPQGWAATLGWQDRLTRTATLPPLSRMGVEEALASMGDPLAGLADQAAIIEQLYRLTEGDPLLVRLYVQEFEKQKATVGTLNNAALQQMTPGLQGYFDQWWKGQKAQWRAQGSDPEKEEAHLRLLLDALAAAFGPLTLDDLANLHPELGSSRLIRAQLQWVERWVIGDGKTQGYSYSHPRLGYYFWEKLGKLEQTSWDKCFCDWGAATLAALNVEQPAPKATPVYILRHYAAHLERSQAPAGAFYALISDGWRRAWEQVDISYSGFLNDVDRAWERARQAYDPNRPGRAEALVQQIRAMLCRASIAKLSNNIPPELLGQLVAAGLRTPVQALAIIKLVTFKSVQAKMLAMLAPYLPPELIDEAFNLVSLIESDEVRASVLSTFAPYLPESLLAKALNIILKIDNSSYWFPALRSFLPYLPKSLLMELWTIAITNESDYSRAFLLNVLIPYLPEITLNEATIALQALDVHCLYSLLPYLPIGALKKEKIKNLQAYITGFDSSIYLALHLPQEDQDRMFNNLLRTLRRRFWGGYEQGTALCTLVPYLPEHLLQKALAHTRKFIGGKPRVDVLCALAPRLNVTQRSHVVQDALDSAYSILSPNDERLFSILNVIPHLPVSEREQAIEYILDNLHLVGDFPTRASVRPSILSKLSIWLSESVWIKLLKDELRIAQFINDNYSARWAMEILAPYMPERAREEVYLLADPYWYHDKDQWITLTRIDHQYELEYVTEMELASACSAWDPDDRADALRELAPRLPVILLEKVFELTWSLRPLIESGPITDRLFRALAPRFVEWSQQLPQSSYESIFAKFSSIVFDSRSLFLHNLYYFIPAILVLAGDEAPQAAEGIYHAIQEVCEWWP